MWSGWLAVDMMIEDENVKENCQQHTSPISYVQNCQKDTILISYVKFYFQHWKQSMWLGWLAVDMMVEDNNVMENCKNRRRSDLYSI